MQWLLECSSAHLDFFAFPVPEGNVILDKVNLKYKFVTCHFSASSVSYSQDTYNETI